MLKPLIIAFQLLTRIPMPHLAQVEERDMGNSILFYPLVGLVIGGLLAGINWLMFEASVETTAAVILIAWVLVTGALHLDGLGDSADAWVGGFGDRERTLAIMKDPYCGPAAVAMIVLVLIGKYAALQNITTEGDWLALLLIPVLSRTLVPLLFLTTPYVRVGGMGSGLTNHLPVTLSWLLIVAVTAVTIASLLLTGVYLLLMLVCLFLLMRLLMVKRIGGTTGDTAGAMIEIAELTLLLSWSLLQ
jgi:adenosylcobinamide-GDP ribazoletransferase